jgi:hypothetical protein
VFIAMMLVVGLIYLVTYTFFMLLVGISLYFGVRLIKAMWEV